MKQTRPKPVYSVEQRKALELMAIVDEKCPIAQRDLKDRGASFSSGLPCCQHYGYERSDTSQSL